MTNQLAPLPELRFETAAEHYTANVPIFSPADLAGCVRTGLAGHRFASVDEIVLFDPERRLAGLVNIEDLLSASEGTPLAAIIDAAPPLVTPGVDQEHFAWLAIQHGETRLPVADEQRRLKCLITPHRICEVLLLKHDEDTSPLGGP